MCCVTTTCNAGEGIQPTGVPNIHFPAQFLHSGQGRHFTSQNNMYIQYNRLSKAAQNNLIGKESEPPSRVNGPIFYRSPVLYIP